METAAAALLKLSCCCAWGFGMETFAATDADDAVLVVGVPALARGPELLLVLSVREFMSEL